LTAHFGLHTVFSKAMVKWGTALILTLTLAGGALAGVPMHSGEKHCPMMGTDDCCEKAEDQSNAPQVYTARLCCSLNCSLPGTTGPMGTTLKGPSVAQALHSALNTLAAYSMPLPGLLASLTPERNQHSPPIYIQHLALLI
jgi:hypothetical protein